MTQSEEDYRGYKITVSTEAVGAGCRPVFGIVDPKGVPLKILNHVDSPIFPEVSDALVHARQEAKLAVDNAIAAVR